MARRVEFLITGGGTGGHVIPALALARALVREGRPRASVLLVGSSRGLEAKLLDGSGFPLLLLPGRGIVRRFSWRNVGAVLGLAVAFLEAVWIVASRKPRAVVMVGGYAGVACSLAALVLRVPVVVVNVDAVPGAANRLVGRFAKAAAVAGEGSGLKRAVVTGAPLREEVVALVSPESRGAARAAFGVEVDRLLLVVTGGSLGAGRLNDAALALREALADRGDLTIIHISGERDFSRMKVAPAPDGVLDYRLVAYEPRLPELVSGADLVLARAGAMTVAELAVIGVPSVLVPLPGAPGDHQRRNAELLASDGGAVIVDDDAVTAPAAVALIESLLADGARRAEMGARARAHGRPHAAEAVAELIEQVATRRFDRSAPSGPAPSGPAPFNPAPFNSATSGPGATSMPRSR